MTNRMRYFSILSFSFSRRLLHQAALFAGLVLVGNSNLPGVFAAEITTGTWTWQAGDNNQASEFMPVYGEQGVPAAANKPGYRDSEAHWTDANGDTWVFGGFGYAENDYGTLNDFWKYDAETGYWTWLGGSKDVNGQGFYGTQGIASAENFPPNRAYAATWLDSSGNLWMFGGTGSAGPTRTGGLRSDLWKYDITQNQWTWVKGEQSLNSVAIPGTVGTPAVGNSPGGRKGCSSWYGHDGSLWLFGGSDPAYKSHNDVWKFDPTSANWTQENSGSLNGWVQYGPQGVENYIHQPPSVNLASTWVDSSGNLWMYGGMEAFSSRDAYSDVWRYNTATNLWTWVEGNRQKNRSPFYREQGVTGLGTSPGARYQSASWMDSSDNLWLFGGYAESFGLTAPYLNDLWKFDTNTAQWTWMKGSKIPGTFGTTGTLGIADISNNPAARYKPYFWKSTSNTLNLMGGVGISLDVQAHLADSWSYDITSNNWTWNGGEYEVTSIPKPTYGTQGDAAPGNTPGPRQDANTWTTSDGTLWLYGGQGYVSSHADLWSFDQTSKLWTWQDGTTATHVAAFYSSLGVTAPENTPGSVLQAPAWVDKNDNLWLFNNSIWKYDMAARDWACMDPGTTAGLASYGEMGVADDTNSPGLRNDAATWQDADGNLWLFGGYGKPTGSSGRLNDLWKYEIASGLWTWVTGSNDINSTGSYGQQGIEMPENSPSARQNSTAWLGADGSLWLYGGEVADNLHFGNDLWKFNPQSGCWTWMAGSDQVDQPASYGQLGTEAVANTPGARSNSISWTDTDGDLWLFGGELRGSIQLADIWKYNIETGQWAWMGGSRQTKAGGVYGTQQAGSADNFPGARTDSAVWKMPDHSLWLFGGFGMDAIGGYPAPLSDMWQFIPTVPVSAVDWDTAQLYQ